MQPAEHLMPLALRANIYGAIMMHVGRFMLVRLGQIASNQDDQVWVVASFHEAWSTSIKLVQACSWDGRVPGDFMLVQLQAWPGRPESPSMRMISSK